MGRRLVAMALLPMANLDLSTRARLVLVGMANQAKDTDPEPVYFGGWAYLSGCLGYPEYGETARRQVAKGLAELRKKHLVMPLDTPRPGKNVPYLIRLSTGWGEPD